MKKLFAIIVLCVLFLTACGVSDTDKTLSFVAEDKREDSSSYGDKYIIEYTIEDGYTYDYYDNGPAKVIRKEDKTRIGDLAPIVVSYDIIDLYKEHGTDIIYIGDIECYTWMGISCVMPLLDIGTGVVVIDYGVLPDKPDGYTFEMISEALNSINVINVYKME